MGYLVGEGVFLGEAAAVVGVAVVVLALHPSVAGGAVDQSAEDVRVAGALPDVLSAGSSSAPAQDGLGLLEGRVVDEWFVGDLLGDHPLVAGVPAHDAGVAHCHVVDVEQHLVGALLGPDLTAGVAGVGEDDADGALGPGDAAAVPVADAVMG
nr:hypothetical protein [Micromonospora coriariae]